MTGESVLIVGEDGIIAFHLHRLLLQAGCVPEDPITTKDVPDRLSTLPLPHLIVVDEGIPGNPESLVLALQILRRRGIPVIILTSFSDTRETERLIAIPHALFISKPFSGNDILLAIKRKLDGDPQCP
jgi:DNA-binding NarL/FixJ family response regulator